MPNPTPEKNRAAVAKHYVSHKDEILKRKAAARVAKGLGITQATADKFGLTVPEKKEDPRVEKMNNWMLENKSASTAKMYSTQLKKAIKSTDSDDVGKLLEWFEANSVNPNTKRTALQALLCYSENNPDALQAYQAADEAATEYNIQRSFDEQVESFNTIKEKVSTHYPEGSDQRLYMGMYDLVPTRDDFGSVELVGKGDEPKTDNWLNTNTRQLHIGDHKTSGKYGPIETKLPKQLIQMIPAGRKHLFEKTEGKPYGSMSTFVNNMLKESGIEGKGSINYLRHSYASTELAGSKLKDEQSRREVFSRMMHSPLTQLKYLRTLN